MLVRSIRSDVFFKKCVFKNFAKFTGNVTGRDYLCIYMYVYNI